MKRPLPRPTLFVALALAIVCVGSLRAQTHVTLTNLLFSEDFSGYTPDALPTTTAEGGRWATVTWGSVTYPPGGFAGVVQDANNDFGEGTANQFFRATSTSNLNLTTPTFFRLQEVVSFSFDHIGRREAVDGNRWLNVILRNGTLSSHTTSIRNRTNTIRGSVNTVTVPSGEEPPIGSLGDRTRVMTIMNNRADTISYDRPDGQGTATLTSTNAAVWVYRYTGENAGTWTNLYAEYTFNRTTNALGEAMSSLLFTLDGNAVARSFDIDNITAYGSKGFLPTAYVAITNKLFSEDFESYDPGTPPTVVTNGGKWDTASKNTTNGSWGVLEDVNNAFARGTANRYLQLSNTHNVFLISPLFEPQEALIYSFEFVGRFYEWDGNRWFNMDPRSASGSAHVTSLRMYDTTIRKDGVQIYYGVNDMPIRMVTILNNREGGIIYDRPDGLGTTNLGAGKASVWLSYYGNTQWEHVIPEYIYARTAGFPFGPVVDRIRLYLDSNEVWRSLDLDNIEVYGSIEPSTPPVVLAATLTPDNKLKITWEGKAGKSYQVQYRTSLSTGDWVNQGDAIVSGADGEQSHTDPDGISSSEARFYRVRESKAGA